MSERYEVETTNPAGELKQTFREIDDAMVEFYEQVAAEYSEPSVEVYLHDLIAGKTLIAHNYAADVPGNPSDGSVFTKLQYDLEQ